MSNDFMHQGNLIHRVEQLEKTVNNRTSGRRLENSSIGAGGLRIVDGGKLTIDGGELLLVATNGVTVARWGDVHFSGTSRGWELNYADGNRAFFLGGPPSQQTVGMYDRGGNYVFTTDGITGFGLGRPFLNYRMVAGGGAETVTTGPAYPSTASSAYVELFTGRNPIQHPRIEFGLTTAASGGNTEWRLLIDSEVIAEDSGNVQAVFDIPGWGVDVTPVSTHKLTVEVRNSAGSRSWVQVDKCYGKES